MRSAHPALCLALALLLVLSGLHARGVSADESVPRIGLGNPLLGKQKSDDGRCLECHGEQGLSEDSRIPNHAGQYAGYLIKQLRNFKSGERKNATMNLMAEDLSEADMADIAAYFASQTRMQGEGGHVAPLASSLFLQGDAARNIPACVSCHAVNGKGNAVANTFYPLIGGQHRVYLRSQLVNWKMAERSNSPGGVMNTIAKALTDEEIDALANYISGL